jgi:hypothetical protein
LFEEKEKKEKEVRKRKTTTKEKEEDDDEWLSYRKTLWPSTDIYRKRRDTIRRSTRSTFDT